MLKRYNHANTSQNRQGGKEQQSGDICETPHSFGINQKKRYFLLLNSKLLAQQHFVHKETEMHLELHYFHIAESFLRNYPYSLS
jgi:hypothetical protein